MLRLVEIILKQKIYLYIHESKWESCVQLGDLCVIKCDISIYIANISMETYFQISQLTVSGEERGREASYQGFKCENVPRGFERIKDSNDKKN